jgi:glucan 1,3-beta-glucosidase
VDYWQNHGGAPNPEVFPLGFSQGWDDTLLFLTARDGPCDIGFIYQWIRQRKREYEASHGALGKASWVWETGFKQGLNECETASMQG